MRRQLFIWSAVAALFLDQVTKVAVYGLLAPGESVRLFGGLLRIIHAENEHGVFGIAYGPQFLYFLLPAAGSALVIWFALRTRDRWSATAYGVILGGAVGNLVDRVRNAGQVIDFIDVGWRGFRWYTFNVADSAVVCGVIALLAREFLFRPRPGPTPPEPASADAAGLPRQ
jgi:signal peptidase II